jgi:hypothetical protein
MPKGPGQLPTANSARDSHAVINDAPIGNGNFGAIAKGGGTLTLPVYADQSGTRREHFWVRRGASAKRRSFGEVRAGSTIHHYGHGIPFPAPAAEWKQAGSLTIPPRSTSALEAVADTPHEAGLGSAARSLIAIDATPGNSGVPAKSRSPASISVRKSMF